jgi:hypothetical protein
MKEQYFYMGTIIEFFNIAAYNPTREKFILAEYHDEEFVFQLICIDGYNAGSISGYIKTDPKFKIKHKKAVSSEHLINEIRRNFGNVDFETLTISPR